jgi:hypothetical protein
MFYVYSDKTGKQVLTKSAQDIATLLNKTEKTVRKLLKSDRYEKNNVLVLKFQEYELQKTVRNKKGNPFYQKLTDLKGLKQQIEPGDQYND